jgi:hypothetical protein
MGYGARMRTASWVQRAVAMSLAFLLGSCATMRYSPAGPVGPEDLAGYALIIKPHPLRARGDAVCASASESELEKYCEGRRIQCEQDCLASSRPVVVDWRKYTDTKAQPWRLARYWWCPSNCMAAKEDCTKKRGRWYEEYSPNFRAIEPAVDWIKEHRTELLVGAVVVIAGVAFAVVVVGSGGGVLVLAPLVVLAEVGG